MTLAARLREAIEASSGHDAAPGDDFDWTAIEPTPAAVLIAITDRPAPGVLLTLRTDTLRRHAGQVAFPGGRIDPEDEDAVAAALREAYEEIGLQPDSVDVVAALAPYRTITDYSVTPVIGVVPPDLQYMPHAPEVAAVFEVPLQFLLDDANRAVHEIEHDGRQRRYHEFLWQDRRIWGATAAMIVNLVPPLRMIA